jgi:4-amino-4-deoxy-L-arabinose transferase-like glycosyltransferase
VAVAVAVNLQSTIYNLQSEMRPLITRGREIYDRFGASIWLACILLSSGFAVFRNVGHKGVTYWDEAFHAIVARNLTKHPLKFTLYDQPWLPYDYRDWGGNHIWLHKPPVAMWQIGLSYYALGVNTFALRLPSAITAVIAVWLTYRIAADLFDRRVGLIAAFLQGFNPFLFNAIHGYQYSDHIDIALLFWVEVSCWLLLRAIRTSKARLYLFSGVAMGLAYLSKSYLALITFGMAAVVWLAAKLKRLDLEGGQIRLRDLGIQLGAAALTVAPWAIYCLILYPDEYKYEHRRVFDHLNTDIESWGATWDRPLFDYMVWFYPVFYVAVLAAVCCLIWVMFKRRRLGEFFILAWAIGVIVPHTLATTKTPSATMIGVPPLLIAIALMIGYAWRPGDWRYTAAWFASMLAITLVKGGKSLVAGRDQFDSMQKFAPFVETNFWIIKQLAAFVVILAVLMGVYQGLRRFPWRQWVWQGFRLAALLLALFYAKGYVNSAIQVTNRNADEPLYTALGERIQRELPQNACLFLDDPTVGSHFTLMYYADRSTYVIWHQYMQAPRDTPSDAKTAREAGAIPYLVAVKGETYDYPLVIEGEAPLGDGRTKTYRVYEVVERPED